MHEITETDALLGDLAAPERYFRPNGGGGALGAHLLNGAAARHLMAAQATMVLWNAVPGDFRDADGWPATAHAMLSAARAPVMLVLAALMAADACVSSSAPCSTAQTHAARCA